VDDFPADVADHVDDISAEDINALRDHGLWAFTDTTARDSAIPTPADGQPAYIGDGAETEGLWIHNTAGEWRRPWNLPWGRMASASGTTAPTSASASYVDLTTLATTEAIPSNRRLRWTLRAHTTTTDLSALLAIAMRTTSNTVVDSRIDVAFASTALAHYVEVSWLENTASTAIVTRKVSFQRALGSGTVSVLGDASRPWRFWCSDEGPSGAPA
jgi:hypothetical protein